MVQANPKDYFIYINVLREIIEESTNYQHKPVVYAFEAKHI
ncbi:hypothetical protein HO923_00115 [Streptococcus suis]|nr:hypothetical protein [Streptococcus suis]